MGKGGPANVFNAAFGMLDPLASKFGKQVGILPDGISDGPKGMPSSPLSKGPTDKSPEELRAQKQKYVGTSQAPMFLGLSAGMTPEQQRTSIATNAVNGDGSGTDPEALRYYRSLALGSLIDDKGGFADYSAITPIEHQYLQRAGVQPYKNTTQSFLSALERAIKGSQ